LKTPEDYGRVSLACKALFIYLTAMLNVIAALIEEQSKPKTITEV